MGEVVNRASERPDLQKDGEVSQSGGPILQGS